MTSEASSSPLFYFGSRDGVRLGDRVRIRRWLRRSLVGVVCYLPGVSPRHPELEDSDGCREWAIQLADGSLRCMGYFPDQIQPAKKIGLIARDAPYEPLVPGVRLEEPGDHEGDEPTVRE